MAVAVRARLQAEPVGLPPSDARVLGRGRVDEIQRVRILTAITELVRERGAGAASVAHIVERSGVSRRTFYELFDDREACFMAAFDRAIESAAQATIPAHAAGATWLESVRGALAALLGFLDAEPLLGYLCLVGSLSAGPRALARRADVTAALVEAVHRGRRESSARRRPDRLVAEGVVGAVLAILGGRVQADEAQQPRLSALLNPLMGMIVLPYLGPAAAERELGRATPRGRAQPRAPRDHLRGLDMRLTYRTVRVLLAIAEETEGEAASGRRAGCGPNNREVADAAGVTDQGQISKLLARLHNLGLIENSGGDLAKGEPNAWHLTARGRGIVGTLRIA